VHPAIQVQHVSKTFKYWADRPASLKSLLVDLLRGRIAIARREEISVLDDVSFEIRQGEFVGIMGRNGAGKSTLLKLISGIYWPNRGSIRVHGTVAPLIELGAGFDPDLSGYENIFLNASILGFGRKVTLEALPHIIEFSELGEKIYMPIRNYSSGMLVRLGFSVASHLTAPIMLIDEVLAVGDVGFQTKCLERIHRLHREGRTIVLITHSPEAVEQHCSRCIVIEDKKKVFDGSPKEGTKVYLRAMSPPVAAVPS
jgi:ABC-type polysaccharide/polyol phosphate transport system ATPase subunit